MKNYISENISYLVKKMNCSQDEFGEIFDLKKSSISSYVSKKAQPKIETIQKICEYFNITIDDFINKDLSKSMDYKKSDSLENVSDKTLKSILDRLNDIETFNEVIRVKFQLDLNIEEEELKKEKKNDLVRGK